MGNKDRGKREVKKAAKKEATPMNWSGRCADLQKPCRNH